MLSSCTTNLALPVLVYPLSCLLTVSLQVQTLVDQRTKQLDEAAELWNCYQDSLSFVTDWAKNADSVVASETVLESPEQTEDQITLHEVQYNTDVFVDN